MGMTLADFRRLKRRDFENCAILDDIEHVFEDRDAQSRAATYWWAAYNSVTDKSPTPSSSDPLADSAAEAMIRQLRYTTKAIVCAFQELNAIRARDGIPHSRSGEPYGVSEEYFSSVVDLLDGVCRLLSGKPAHCHPLLYARDDILEESKGKRGKK